VSYYQRPMGDYKTYGYAGDPGFLSSLWKGIKAVGKVVLGFPPVQQAPVQARLPAPPRQLPQQYPQVSFPGVGQRMQRYGPAVGPDPRTRQRPFALPTPAQMGPYGPPGQAACPTGYHLAKDGSGRLVRNRRMNIANPRALRRAMRRVQGFEKLAKRTITFTRRTRLKKRKTT